jgi:hypothetical protein
VGIVGIYVRVKKKVVGSSCGDSDRSDHMGSLLGILIPGALPASLRIPNLKVPKSSHGGRDLGICVQVGYKRDPYRLADLLVLVHRHQMSRHWQRNFKIELNLSESECAEV